jgi:hypothetical protein
LSPKSIAALTYLLAAGLLAAASGCDTAAASEGPAVVYDPCQTTFLLARSDSNAAQRAAIADALGLWEQAGGPRLSVSDGDPDAQVLPIGFDAAAPAFFGLYRPDRGDILINSLLGDARARAITVAHELGHAFGLPHLTGHPSLMNPGNLKVPPAADDAQLIFDRRQACPRPGSIPR